MQAPRVVARRASRTVWPIGSVSIGLALLGSGAVPAQEGQAPPARVAIRSDGVAVLLGEGQTAPPLFGKLLGDEEDSLGSVLQNYGGPGFLGLFFGAPRPVSTMIDVRHYCGVAGVSATTEDLCAMVAGSPERPEGESPRHRFDRIAAATLLARTGTKAAVEPLRAASASGDRLTRLWAKHLADQLEGKPAAIKLPVDDLATVLAEIPKDSGVVIVVDNAHAPEWHDLWRNSAVVWRAVRDKAAGLGGASAEVIAYGDRMRDRCDLLAYELARRFGDACVVRSVLTAPTLFAKTGPFGWCRSDGLFHPDSIATGLRAEGVAVETDQGTVRARLGETSTLRATTTSLEFAITPDAERLGAAGGKALAERLSGANVALAVELVKEGQFAPIGLPEPAKPILDELRRIIVRHRTGTDARLQLELHYADKKVATVAGAALGALLTVARTQAKDAPASVRDLLRELTVSSDGPVVRAEVELEMPLGALIEEALALAAR